LDRSERARTCRSGAHRGRNRIRDAREVRLGDAVDVSEVGCLADDYAHRRAEIASALRALHLAIVEREREARAALRVQLREVSAACERSREHPLAEVGLE